MELTLYSAKGAKLKQKILADETVFNAPINEVLLKKVVYIARQNQRISIANTKTRGEVRGGGVKPWAQKGTGRARHGSRRSPIWKGGGITFGPRSDSNYKRKLTKRMKKAAIRGVFSFLVKNNKVILIENTNLSDKRLTNQLVEIIKKLPVRGRILFIHKGDNQNLY